MKILDAIVKMAIIAASVSVIVASSTAIWWMENDNIYQKFHYDQEFNKIENRLIVEDYKARTGK